jgi:hypothetical protein
MAVPGVETVMILAFVKTTRPPARNREMKEKTRCTLDTAK